MDINGMLNQTAVYWVPGAFDRNGRPSFSAGEEILVRWQNKNEEFVGAGGEKFFSASVIYFNGKATVPVLDGRLYLGTLASLTVAQQSDPNEVDAAQVVRKVGDSPSLDASQSLGKIWTVE